LAFTADTRYFPELAEFAQDADLLITDTNFDHTKTGKMWHMTAEQSGHLATQAKVKQLLLSHLPQQINHQQLLAEATQNVTGIPILLAKTGLTIEI